MDNFPLPVFNIESDEDEGEADSVEVIETKPTKKCDHLHKLLADRSIHPPSNNPNMILKKLETIAEKNLLRKDLVESNCALPGNPRSTFLMVFSPDGSKVASSHGDHNIYVTDLCTNKCISTLSGHPRTPWCIAFHPHHNDILASGCLGGQVRVWDLHGGSEMWSVIASETTTVIASLAFHPSERLLVIATNSTLYFWDWNFPQPFAKCSTANEKQKLRYVCFDPLGNWLLTGISNGPGSSSHVPSNTATSTTTPAPVTVGQQSTGITGIYRMERHEQERERHLQHRYQTLLDQYERLRVRYQELRYRAAQLEFNASNSNTSAQVSSERPSSATTPAETPMADPSSNPIIDSGGNGSASSSDRFWRTLMNAAENLRALSSIGRTLSNTTSSTSGTSSGSRTTGPSLDHDARIRIQLLSRHIENMQRICRSHLEMTRHRRQVYRLQQIRRILEDLREQIRYLQVCVRDSLDLMSQLRPSTSSSTTSDMGFMPAASAATSGASSNASSHPLAYSGVELTSQQPAPSPVLSTSDHGIQLPGSGDQDRAVFGPRPYTPLQCRRFANYLVCRLRRIGMPLRDEHAPIRARLYRSSHVEGGGPIRRVSLRLGHSPATSSSVDPTDPQPGTSRDYTSEDVPDPVPSLSVEPNIDRIGLGSSLARWRRSRFTRLSQRSPSQNRSNSLLHMRNSSLTIQRRKSSVFNRVFHVRSFQNQLRSAAAAGFSIPSTAANTSATANADIPSQESGQRSNDQSLRPLMERLESHFRLQRQTMGILAQLNEATTTSAAGLTSSFSDSSLSSRPWANDAAQYGIRDWRSRGESMERTHSLESSRTTSNDDRFQMPRRVDSSLDFGGQSRYRSFPPLVDDDSSDTDTDMTNDNVGSSNRWRQSSPIRSPRGVEQRMRLLWMEYLSQVVHAQSTATENQQGSEADSAADQERNRYRLWLSTMVESLTSFFSQHGINSSEPDAAPSSSTSSLQPPEARNNNNNVNPTDQPTVGPSRVIASPPWRGFPRAMDQMQPGGGPIPESYGGAAQRWHLRRNAESQVSLNAHLSLTYRIQAWDFRHGFIPDIRDPQVNVVVPESKIHNDASVDVSDDGRFLVTLVPCTSLTGALISLHSLEPSRLGDCLAQVNVDQFVVSVSISPTCSHLLLGLASSRALSVASRDPVLPTLWAQVYKIPSKAFQYRKNGSSQVRSSEKKDDLQRILEHVRDLGQTTDIGMTSLNCIRWIPTAGQGFVLGTNKGHLKVLH